MFRTWTNAPSCQRTAGASGDRWSPAMSCRLGPRPRRSRLWSDRTFRRLRADGHGGSELRPASRRASSHGAGRCGGARHSRTSASQGISSPTVARWMSSTAGHHLELSGRAWEAVPSRTADPPSSEGMVSFDPGTTRVPLNHGGPKLLGGYTDPVLTGATLIARRRRAELVSA